jgi:hypothetical protein
MIKKHKKKLINIVNMATKDSCTFYPYVGSEPSLLYKQLLGKVSRPLTNYIYARYIVSNMGDLMDHDSRGYKRNKQGEHNAKDVLEFIEFAAKLFRAIPFCGLAV